MARPKFLTEEKELQMSPFFSEESCLHSMIRGTYVSSYSDFGVSMWYMQAYEEIDLW